MWTLLLLALLDLAGGIPAKQPPATPPATFDGEFPLRHEPRRPLIPEPLRPRGLQIEAWLAGRRVEARLRNTSAAPIEVLVGYTCGGPEPFVAIVDGVERSFQTGMIVCTGNAMVIERLAPGAQRVVSSDALILDGDAHRLAVRYKSDAAIDSKLWRGVVTSPELAVSAAELAVDLTARAGSAKGSIDIEIRHRWHGTTPLRFLTGWAGVCAGPQDGLLLDGVPRSFIEQACDGPAAPLVETVAPDGTFVTRGTIHVPAGYHRLRARYRVDGNHWKTVGIKGNIGEWGGDRESPEVNVLVR